ncbi:hypothetical protein FRB91_005743 [Serendipita sp. 411]|nr:hypothetical protein FRB91_005743 [Serendipita sp. 411]
MSVTEQSIEKLKLTSKEELCYSRLNDALEPYARAVTSCWSSCSCVRLYCTVPTCPPRNADLQDLKDLQSRCFGFMHALVKLLRTSGVSYFRIHRFHPHPHIIPPIRRKLVFPPPPSLPPTHFRHRGAIETDN